MGEFFYKREGYEKGIKNVMEHTTDINRLVTSWDPSGKAHPEESMDAPNGVSNG